MSMVGELNKELESLNKKHEIEISAIISRSGVPIAWNIPDNNQIETFSTLSATILGASEVVYSSLEQDPPNKIVIESNSGLLMASSVGSKALIAIFAKNAEPDKLAVALNEAVENVKEVLTNEQGKI